MQLGRGGISNLITLEINVLVQKRGGGGVSEIAQIYVTSFMNDPYVALKQTQLLKSFIGCKSTWAFTRDLWGTALPLDFQMQ